MDSLLSRLDGIERAETAAGVPLVSGTFRAGEHDRVWRALRAEQPRTGLWPVLGWTAESAAEGTYQWCREGQGPAWLAAVREIDPAERMALIIESKLEWTLDGGDPTDPQVAAWQEEDRAGFDPVRVAATIGPLTESPPGIARQTRSYPPSPTGRAAGGTCRTVDPMSQTAPDDVLAVLRDFVARIDALDPAAPRQGELTVGLGDVESRMTLSTPIARALVQALQAYHDPRDQGPCDYCGGRRIDNNFLCLDCGQPNGLFGQLIAERAARHTEQRPVAATPTTRGRHVRDDDRGRGPATDRVSMPSRAHGEPLGGSTVRR